MNPNAEWVEIQAFMRSKLHTSSEALINLGNAELCQKTNIRSLNRTSAILFSMQLTLEWVWSRHVYGNWYVMRKLPLWRLLSVSCIVTHQKKVSLPTVKLKHKVTTTDYPSSWLLLKGVSSKFVFKGDLQQLKTNTWHKYIHLFVQWLVRDCLKRENNMIWGVETVTHFCRMIYGVASFHWLISFHTCQRFWN